MGDESGWSEANTAATAQVLSAGINYASAAQANRKGRKWAEQMYDRQRSDAIADWNMGNDYNSPAAQMKRLKEAGLNPHLVYGNGATQQGGVIRSSSVESWKPTAPQLDVSGAGNALMQGVMLRNTEAQTDNIKANRRLIDQQIIQSAATTQSIGQQTEMSSFNLEQLKKKALIDIAQVEANLASTRANTQYTLDQNDRSALSNAQNLQTGIENILNLRAQRAQTGEQTNKIKQEIDNLKSDNTLKELDIVLKQHGIQPGDPMWARAIAQMLKSGDIKKAAKKIMDNIGNISDYLK